jgi:hypothetical protein
MGGFHGLIGSPLVFFIPIKSKTVPPGILTRAQIRSSHDPSTSLRLKNETRRFENRPLQPVRLRRRPLQKQEQSSGEVLLHLDRVV